MAQNALRIGAGVLVAAGVSALLNRWLAQKAERRNPPLGRFITVDGVRLHYVDRGTGTPLFLLHGNGSMIEDFQSSGLIDLAAKNYRVIAIDRPGFGHSNRPRSTVWTPQAQADLIAAALGPLLLRKIFGPSPVPEKFKGFPEEMTVRPSQIRASAAESALMIPSAHTLEQKYRLLQMPVAIVAGAEDRLIESEQSAHLHRDISHSSLRSVPGTGHMVHQTATSEIMSAIELVASQNRKPVAVTSAA